MASAAGKDEQQRMEETAGQNSCLPPALRTLRIFLHLLSTKSCRSPTLRGAPDEGPPAPDISHTGSLTGSEEGNLLIAQNDSRLCVRRKNTGKPEPTGLLKGERGWPKRGAKESSPASVKLRCFLLVSDGRGRREDRFAGGCRCYSGPTHTGDLTPESPSALQPLQ